MTKKWLAAIVLGAVLSGVGGLGAPCAYAQHGAAAAGELAAGGEGAVGSPSIWQVISHSGAIGIGLWLLLISCSVIMASLAIDSYLTISKKKICPQDLIDKVQQAMQTGDLSRAEQLCREQPCPLSRILSAGFAQASEGFEVIQESIGVAADMEVEKLLQRVSYLNVVANVAPMLGLVGTVHGMIMAFMTMSNTPAGAAQQAMLAMNIGQGLWATLVGLGQTVPAMVFYQFFKNRTNTLALFMEQTTMESIKVFRGAEVSVEGGEQK